MYYIRPLFMKYIAFSWRNGTPFQKFPSPCLPEKEFLETELHIDKSTAFGPEFFERQKTWKGGLAFSLIEIALCPIVAFLITKTKAASAEEFKKKYESRFKKEI